MVAVKPEYQDDTPALLLGTADHGPTNVAVLRDAGKVILKFPAPKLWVAFDANGAHNVADAMKAEADLISNRITQKDRMEFAAKRMRDQLITRVTLMLTSMERDGKKPAYQAAHVVDQVLQAISEMTSR